MHDGSIDPGTWRTPSTRSRPNHDGFWATVDPVAPVVLGGLDHAVAVAGLAIGVVGLVALGLFLRDRMREDDRQPTTRSETEVNVLTDRERVQQLLVENGGRMKQADIVDSVDWSKAKVSRLLADLEADDEITKLRLGRENLICRPGSEPAASRSTTKQSGDE